jgi:hypothetical protein
VASGLFGGRYNILEATGSWITVIQGAGSEWPL